MKREILFRGKDKFDNTWTYGFLYIDERNGKHWILTSKNTDKDMHMDEVIPETIGQCINLLDKNGKKIFENDILKSESEVIYVIKWIGAIGGFYLSMPNTYRGKEIISCAASQWHNEEINLYKMEVAGNIHDNPELISTGSIAV